MMIGHLSNIQVFLFSFFSVFFAKVLYFTKASRTRSQTADSVPTFHEQNLLKEPKKEVCSLDNADIAALKIPGSFPAGAIIPRHVPYLCIEDLLIAYRLRSHGSNQFLLFSTSKDPLILKATKNEDDWRRKFFLVKRDSIDKGVDLPGNANFKELSPPSAESEGRIKEIYRLPEIKNLELFDLDELDSYSGPVQVKEETNLKPAVPKPSTASKSRGPSSRKRKEPDSPAASDVFPFENHGFSESSKFMTGFLNQGLERLVFLYED
ncbi:hypothetical protein Hanom_Chr06g00566051 [Helianthus anomalus]